MNTSTAEHLERFKRPSLFRAGIILGTGLGGFFDGIVFHQILGWHHLICTTETCVADSLATLQKQNTQDGWFHFAMWWTTIAGLALLLRAVRLGPTPFRPRAFWGGAVCGWGLFNLFEGLINHQILDLHHVRPGDPHWIAWDIAFLGSGLLLAFLGWRAARR